MKIIKNMVFVMTMGLMFAGAGKLFASVTDDRIVTAAKNSYVFKTYLKSDDIKVASNNGVVTLEGSVEYDSDKSLAEGTVENLPGVKSVDDRLTVAGASKSQDWMLIAKIKTTLMFHKNVNAYKTDVTAQNGLVTLKGEAASQSQKDLTTEYVKDIDGVNAVDNKMTVAASAKTPMKKLAETIDDASITTQVKTALLFHRSTSSIKTSVKTVNGTVTLEGQAKDDAEKTLVTKLVEDINGVKIVDNRMTVQ